MKCMRVTPLLMVICVIIPLFIWLYLSTEESLAQLLSTDALLCKAISPHSVPDSQFVRQDTSEKPKAQVGVKPYDSEYEMRLRARNVQLICQNRKFENTLAHRYIVSDSLSFAYFPVAKCGWSTWTEIFFTNAGKAAELDDPEFKWGWDSPFRNVNMRILSSTVYGDVRNFTERFLFVRNPWDRLVSAYKDKVARGNYSFWFKKPCEWLTEGMPHLTFFQFIQCIVQSGEKYGGGDMGGSRVSKKLDSHWIQQYWTSMPCSSNYTLIGSFDHMTEDLNTAIRILRLKSLNVHRNKGVRETNQTLSYWYKQIPEYYIEALKKIYIRDFEVFSFPLDIP